MEELRSTDALDQEIRADAKKRAERIIAKAEETCSALLGGVEQKLGEAMENARNKSRQIIDLYTKNINASLPLEKERCLVSYIYGSVIDAINGYFDSLGAQKRLDVVAKMVERAIPLLEGREVKAECVGLDVASAKKLLAGYSNLKTVSCTAAAPALMADEELEGFAFHEGLVLSSTDGKITCRLTLDEKLKEILDGHTYDLAKALFGGRIPE